jgi:hypothetical protein
MDVTLSVRMGEPEVGTTYLPVLVSTRTGLKQTVADGVDRGASPAARGRARGADDTHRRESRATE